MGIATLRRYHPKPAPDAPEPPVATAQKDEEFEKVSPKTVRKPGKKADE